MGAKFSTFEFLEKSSHSSSLILTFHSTAKWKAHFDASKESNKLMVIDFTATWCGLANAWTQLIIKDFAAKYTDVEFIKIDVDELMEVAWPRLVVVKVVGAKKEELQKLIEKHRN